MSEILDEESNKNEKIAINRTRSKTILQCALMLIGTILLSKYGLATGAIALYYQLVIVSFLIMLLFFLFAVICNGVLYVVQKRKFHPHTFLFEIIGGGFYFWLIIVGIIVFDRVL